MATQVTRPESKTWDRIAANWQMSRDAWALVRELATVDPHEGLAVTVLRDDAKALLARASAEYINPTE